MEEVAAMKRPSLISLVVAIVLLKGCPGLPDGVEHVSLLDITRYQGFWYEKTRLEQKP